MKQERVATASAADQQGAVNWDTAFVPLTAHTRGGYTEVVHRGVLAVAGPEGELLGGVGAPQTPVHLRSAAKPFQALALVASGAAAALDLTDEELAVACASHSGEERHVTVVSGLLDRLGFTSDQLSCGVHPPFNRQVRRQLEARGQEISPLYNNCSGKHAGMLALTRFLGVPSESYRHFDHPVQRLIREEVAAEIGKNPIDLGGGIDRCGVPVLRVTVQEGATLYARLAAGSSPALRRVRDAMLAYPELVGGEGRFDTRAMRALPGRLVSKVGAQGVQGIALLPRGSTGSSIGALLKLEDGTAESVPLVVAALLEAWEEEAAARAVLPEAGTGIRNLAGEDVGEQMFLPSLERLRQRTSAGG